jgi:DNA-binding CsgD family transcriptional regulator
MNLSDTPWRVAAEAEEAMKRYQLLSPMEARVLGYLLTGKALNEVAEILNKSPSTVGTYKHRMMRKLRVKNDLQLLQLGLVAHYERRIAQLTADLYALSIGVSAGTVPTTTPAEEHHA